MTTRAGNDLEAPPKESFIALKIYQYNLLTGLYMLDPWERALFSEYIYIVVVPFVYNSY